MNDLTRLKREMERVIEAYRHFGLEPSFYGTTGAAYYPVDDIKRAVNLE